MNSMPVNVSLPGPVATKAADAGTGISQAELGDFQQVLASQGMDGGDDEQQGETDGASILMGQLLVMGIGLMPSQVNLSKDDAASVDSVAAVGGDANQTNLPIGVGQETGQIQAQTQVQVQAATAVAASANPGTSEETSSLQEQKSGVVDTSAQGKGESAPVESIPAEGTKSKGEILQTANAGKGAALLDGQGEKVAQGAEQSLDLSKATAEKVQGQAGESTFSDQSEEGENLSKTTGPEGGKTEGNGKGQDLELKIAFPEAMAKAVADKAPAAAENRPLREQILHRMVEQLRVMESPSSKEVSIQLKPDFLGKMDLKITMEDGVVSAKFLAESQQVKGLIENSLPQLRQALQDAGVKMDKLEVGVGQGAAGGSQQGYQQNPSQEAQKERFEQLARGQGRTEGGFAQGEGIYRVGERAEGPAALYRRPDSSVEYIA